MTIKSHWIVDIGLLGFKTYANFVKSNWACSKIEENDIFDKYI